MSVTVSIKKEDDYLIVEYSGKYEGDINSLKMDEVKKICQQHKISHVLVDASKCKLNVTSVDKYRLGKSIADMFIAPQRIKIASLVSPDEYDVFVTLVATNRGASYDIFTDKNKALEWLFE